jgi:hypothetical protein
MTRYGKFKTTKYLVKKSVNVKAVFYYHSVAEHRDSFVYPL